MADEEVDPLDQFRDDEEAIELIAELYNASPNIAKELWQHFIGTVERMRTIVNPSEIGTVHDEDLQ